MTPWHIEGRELASCNCDVSCPCQFNSPPTNGGCTAVVGLEIERGRFGDVPLDGTRAVAVMSWPGPIHAGHGKAQIVIDKTASEPQRAALLKILSGQETEPGTTVFNVFASTLEQVFDPVFEPVSLEIDIDSRRGTVRVGDMVQVDATPILNPLTGMEHRVRIDMPEGFEFRLAEVARASGTTSGPIAFRFSDSHAHFAQVRFNQNGIPA